MKTLKEIFIENVDKSGRMYREKYLKVHFPEILEDILKFIINNIDIEYLPFKQKVYHYINDIKYKVKCKNPNCDNEVKFKNSTIGYYEYCSNYCIGSDPEMIKLKEKKSLEKFGTKAPAMSDEIKEKIINTNQERYGANSPLQNKEIKKKSQDTLMKNYGVDNPNKSEILLNRRVESFKENINQWKEKYTNTIYKRHNGDIPYIKDPDIIKRTIYTKAKKWIENAYKKYKDVIFVDVDIDNREFIIKCDYGKDHDFKISFNHFRDRYRNNIKLCTECNPINSHVSSLELELRCFIEQNYKDDIIINSRKIIPPYEIDIYLPDINLAFEFNGIYWHDDSNKDNNYHLNKTNMCKEKNIQLIHIWQDSWQHHKDIVMSMILHHLNKTKNRVFGRKCIIKEINSKQESEFLKSNHLQGTIGSSMKLGLFYENELISVMTFGKKRAALGNKERKEGEYELLRFCNRLNTNVIGAASKLFKYFINKYEPCEILTFADRCWSNGKIYEKLGFELIGETKPNYFYIIDGIRKHRFGFRKDILVKEGYDPNKTEIQIMEERGINRVFDSGHLKFIYKKKNIL
jgi:very-short-patch-repair endonuclease